MKSSNKYIIGAIVIIAVIAVVTLKQPTETTSGQAGEYTMQEYALNEMVQTKSLDFKVVSSKEEQKLTNEYGESTDANPSGKFVVIAMEVVNQGSIPTLLNANDFVLVDQNRRFFIPFENSITAVDNYLNVRELSPSLPEQGVLVYEVPKDSTDYSINFLDGTVYKKVDL